LSNQRQPFFSSVPESALQAVAGRRHLLEMLPHPAALFDCEAAGMLVEANNLFHDAFWHFHPILALPDFDAIFVDSPNLTSALKPAGRDSLMQGTSNAKVFRDNRGHSYLISYRLVRGPVVRDGLLLMVHDVTSMMEHLPAAVPLTEAGLHEGDMRTTHMEKLTPREREVLHLVVEGKLNKTIADILGISIKTVELHRSRMMRKLEVRNVAELVRLTLKAA
jgi:DNA-binding CsgD family transcriptional regulator